MQEPPYEAHAGDLEALGAAAQEYLQANPAEGVAVPVHPAMRLAAGACDFVIGSFFVSAASCTVLLCLFVILGLKEKDALTGPLYMTLAALAAAVYTLPEAFGHPTLAKSWFRFRICAIGGDARSAYRQRWLLKASPWLLLSAAWGVGTISVALADGADVGAGASHWVRDVDRSATFLVANGLVLLALLSCFGGRRQALYDRLSGTLVVRTLSFRQQRGSGFEVIPMATSVDVPPTDVPGLAAPDGGGYPPAADHE